MSRQQIIEEIGQLDETELEQVSKTLSQIEQKRRPGKTFEELAGAWADMDEALFQDLLTGKYRHQPGEVVSNKKA